MLLAIFARSSGYIDRYLLAHRRVFKVGDAILKPPKLGDHVVKGNGIAHNFTFFLRR